MKINGIMDYEGIKLFIQNNEDITLTYSVYVNDYSQIKRSLFERLFTKPWKPLNKYKTIYNPMAYCFGTSVIVSPQTYTQILKDLPSVKTS